MNSNVLLKWSLIAASGAIFLYVVFYLPKNKKNDANSICATRIDSFEKNSMDREVVDRSDLPIKVKVIDFFITYSPSMSRCIGGYTTIVSYPSGQQDYSFIIQDVDTNDLVELFNADSIMLNHPEYAKIKDGRDAAEYEAWTEYKTKLSELSGGRINAP